MSSSSSYATPPPSSKRRPAQTYDVFISHAGPDKDTMAKPLHEKLENHGISAFVDDKELRPGHEAQSALMEAMETATIGVFILSADFVARKWPVKEVYCFLERVEKAVSQRREKPVLIPVFYRLTTEQCHSIESLLDLHEGGKSPFIEGRFIQRLRKGEPEAQLDKLQTAFTSLVSHTGIRNVDNVTNDDSNDMTAKRGRLIDEIVKGVVGALKERDEPEEKTSRPSHSVPDAAVETTDSFQARFYLPIPLPNIVLNWECDSDGEPMTMEGSLKKAIMESTQDLDASVVAAVDGAPIGMCGHGGVGKTTALIGVGREEDVQRHFKDGVYFATVGGDASDGSMVEALALLVQQCGGAKTCSQVSSSESLGEAIQLAAVYFRGKRALFMFDDLWPTEKSAAGYLKEIRQLVATCPESRIVISTRSNYIAGAGRSQVVFEPRDAEGRVAREILCRSADIEAEELVEYKEELRTVLRFCMGLPLTLQVAGCAIRELKDGGLPLCDAIDSYVEDLQDERSEPARESGAEYSSFEDTVRVSLRIADKWCRRKWGDRGGSGRSVSELYERLAVLGRQMHAPRSMLKVLWALETDRDTDVVLKKLRDLNLVKRRKKGNEVGAEVHDLLLEFCEHAAGEKVKEYHADVLSGYYKLRGASACQSGGSESDTGLAGWSDVEADVRCWWEDGLSKVYIAENVCRHLAGAGKCGELAMLLTDARWALAQVRRRTVMGWMGDFDELFRAAEGSDFKNCWRGLELVRDGVREAWYFLTRSEREFGWQMYARLVDQGERGWAVRRFLDSTSQHADKPWLRPRLRCFPVPGGKRFAFSFDDRKLESVAFLDSKAVVSVGKIGLKNEDFIVNLETGEREKILAEEDAVRVAGDVGMGSDMRRRDRVRITLNKSTYVTAGGDGGRIVSGSWDQTLTIWDAGSEESVDEPPYGHNYRVRCVAVSGDGRRIVSKSSDGRLRVWDAWRGECVSEPLRGHTDGVRCVAVSGDGQRILFWSQDMTLRVWDARSGNDTGKPLRGHPQSMECTAMSEDGRVIVFGFRDGTLRVWDAVSGECVGEPLRGHLNVVNCVVVSGDGRRIVSGSRDETLRVWDARSGECVGAPLCGHSRSVHCVALSGDGRLILSGSRDKAVRLWDASVECMSEPPRGHTHRVMCVAVSRDGQRMVSGSEDRRLRLWDAGSGESVGELGSRRYNRQWWCVAVIGDGRRMVSGSVDRTLSVWDAVSGERVGKPLWDHDAAVTCVAVSEDGGRIVSGSVDKSVRLWDAGRGECVDGLGHSAILRCVAVSGDGRWIVSWDERGQCKVWDTSSGKKVVLQLDDCMVSRVIMTETMVTSYGSFGPVKWKLDETAGLVRVQGGDEDDKLDVWCVPQSTVVMLRCQGQEFIVATLPNVVCDGSWDFDLHHKNFAAGLENGSVVWGEMVV